MPETCIPKFYDFSHKFSLSSALKGQLTQNLSGRWISNFHLPGPLEILPGVLNRLNDSFLLIFPPIFLLSDGWTFRTGKWTIVNFPTIKSAQRKASFPRGVCVWKIGLILLGKLSGISFTIFFCQSRSASRGQDSLFPRAFSTLNDAIIRNFWGKISWGWDGKVGVCDIIHFLSLKQEQWTSSMRMGWMFSGRVVLSVSLLFSLTDSMSAERGLFCNFSVLSAIV